MAKRNKDKEATQLVLSPEADGFLEKITPKDPGTDLFLFKCPHVTKTNGKEEKCGGIHYRHAGYVQVLLPYIEPPQAKKMVRENNNVMVCVKCRRSYVWCSSQMYDVTDQIDLKAWEKMEIDIHDAIGPGGNC